MIITSMKTNHITNPLGFDIQKPVFSWKVTDTAGKKQTSAQVQVAKDSDFAEVVYDSGEAEGISSLAFEVPMTVEPCTRYYWKVIVRADNGDAAESDTAWFETAKDSLWDADWITPDAAKDVQATLFKSFTPAKPVKQARIYILGLGLYELYLNGDRQGEECLLPGFHDYDSWLQYQTFELDLKEGENLVEVMLGDGWYKGDFGLRIRKENYGDRLALIAEIHITYEDGTVEKVVTDTSWKARKHFVVKNGIYDGEAQNPAMDTTEVFGTKKLELDKTRLTPRLSPRITIHENIKPIEKLLTPAGETVLDMGQNMVGWLSFHCKQPAGTRLHLQFGEILQEGNFYNDNLRTAKAEFFYIADGKECDVRQYFTFYGFRYVKVSGWVGELNKDDFTGLVIHSEMDEIGTIETSDPLVNQLIQNAKWGQKGNFLDVPTDCPQRDERYGWTGDAQVFSGTALYNTDAYAFYRKYGRDVYEEQKKLDGSVPDVVPTCNYVGDASTVWADAATIIPWNVYMHSGDKQILEHQYNSMKDWVDYMKRQDDRYGAKRMWMSGTHYGDWLALDGNVPGGVYGATKPYYIASAYYYYSTSLLAKAAAVLGKKEDAQAYGQLADEIKDAFQKEYFTGNGNLSIDTMTAYTVALYMGLVPKGAEAKAARGLKEVLIRNRYHLNSGFVGTPLLCRVLSENGMNDIAYHLLMEKGYPGWLYEVLMGATTIWERWNSVLPDGRISGTEMNSLNHYSYGSIVEWMYRHMIGIEPLEEAPGFKRVRICPKPDHELKYAKASLDSAAGLYRISWEVLDNGQIKLNVTVPFDAEAVLILPNMEKPEEKILTAGDHEFIYTPDHPVKKVYSIDSLMEELNAYPPAKAILEEDFYSVHKVIPFENELGTLWEMANGPFTSLSFEKQKEIDEKLRQL
ncbi:MAG: family 78 glycoside hydrolase catalytic domain [Blautia sp.]|nr:family 78 glycoside hydrolase catalytic domain [Blautia sp.]